MASKTDILADDKKVTRFLVKRHEVDWVLFVACATAAYTLWDSRSIGDLDPLGRRAVYQTLTAVSTALLGLTMTSISILMSNIDKPLAGLPKGMTPALSTSIGRSMFALMRTLAITLALSLTLLVTDTRDCSDMRLAQAALIGLLATSTARLSRVLYLFSEVIPARLTR